MTPTQNAINGITGGVPSNVDITVTAGENLAARDCVYLARNGSAGKTAGQAYKTDADTVAQSTGAFWFGFVTAGFTTGNSGTVRIVGSLGGFVGLTPGAPQYISATAGLLTETAPANAQMVGMALPSGTEILINEIGANTTTSPLILAMGYFAGGNTGGAAPACAIADKITFSTSTTAACTTANLGAVTIAPAGLSDGATKGYFAGGMTPNVSFTAAYKITFSSDTTATCTTANLAAAAGYLAGVYGGSAKGYFSGGWTDSTTYTLATDLVTYSTDATAAKTTANLSLARYGLVGVSNSSSKGYVGGGRSISGSGEAVTDLITFSTDSTAAHTAANLSAGRYKLAGISDGTTKGYFSGGWTGAPTNVTDKITFSTDVTSAQTTANLPTVNGGLQGMSAGSVNGYCSGGGTNAGPTLVATSNKATYSTDTFAAATTANLSGVRQTMGSASGVGY